MATTLSDGELQALEAILGKLAGPGAELPPPLFRFVTEVVATPNVDLLVQDGEGRVLLAWREDAFGTGWHVPGSIIRHREEIAHRLLACAAEEFGCPLLIAEGPAALLQIFDDRGHSVSLCYRATLAGGPPARMKGQGATPRPGDLCWFAALPDEFYPSHHTYRAVIEAARAGRLGPGLPVWTQHTGERDAAQSSPAGTIDGAAALGKLAPGS